MRTTAAQQPGAKAGPLASPAGAAPIAVTESYALPGSLYTVQWSAEEQKILDDTMSKLPQEKYTPLQRYIQVAAQLPNKGVRDVALRVRWIQKRVRLLLCRSMFRSFVCARVSTCVLACVCVRGLGARPPNGAPREAVLVTSASDSLSLTTVRTPVRSYTTGHRREAAARGRYIGGETRREGRETGGRRRWANWLNFCGGRDDAWCGILPREG